MFDEQYLRKFSRDINQRTYDVDRTIEDLQSLGTLDMVKTINDYRAALPSTAADLYAKQIAETQRARLAAWRATDPVTQYRELAQQITASSSAQAYLEASRAATRTLAENREAIRNALSMVQARGFADIARQAADLARIPATRALLRQADAVMPSPSANAQTTELPVLDLPTMPQLEWITLLDRSSLIFMVQVLFHLTRVLSPALGVAGVVQDSESELEDLSVIVGALHLMLAYALDALKAKYSDAG